MSGRRGPPLVPLVVAGIVALALVFAGATCVVVASARPGYVFAASLAGIPRRCFELVGSREVALASSIVVPLGTAIAAVEALIWYDHQLMRLVAAAALVVTAVGSFLPNQVHVGLGLGMAIALLATHLHVSRLAT